MRIGLANGVWYNGASAVIAGAGTVTGATATGNTLYLGYAGIALGILLFAWGVTVNGRKWWQTWQISEFESAVPPPSVKLGRRSVVAGLVPAAFEVGEDAVVLLPDASGRVPLPPGLAAGKNAKTVGRGMALGHGASSGEQLGDTEGR